ncbi:MAG: response regulator, partial [Pseudomonadales bacterium]|jgi:two-component system response regulator RegA|nr:response regulator [Pseudomonadales bacterium]
VSEALNTAAAITLARADAPQLAVVDLKIAQESGLDVLGPLLACNPSMRILILTGYSSIATAVAAIKLGAWDYACKPLDADEILQKLGLDGDATPTASSSVPGQPLSVDRLEWEHIQRVLTENAGNISATARRLGMHRRTLQRKLQKRPVRQ